MEAEAEVGAGEDGESLDEDVGDGLLFRKLGVELVAVAGRAIVSKLARD